MRELQRLLNLHSDRKFATADVESMRGVMKLMSPKIKIWWQGVPQSFRGEIGPFKNGAHMAHSLELLAQFLADRKVWYVLFNTTGEKENALPRPDRRGELVEVGIRA